ncbi:MAG: Stp1/IreP family PP2C-type Ser/Thr phosphatase [Lachnospirales bacterium]
MMAYGRTHKGLVRDNNEDSFYVKEDKVGKLKNLFIVADGVGGHNAGEVASKNAIQHFVEYAKDTTNTEIDKIIEMGIKTANNKIFRLSKEKKTYKGMGTTFTVCVIDENKLHIGHIGDSRLYLINDNIKQITEDHTLVNEMYKSGHLTVEETKLHPKRNVITRALGTEIFLDVDIYTINIEKNDKILLCSDGLNTMLDDEKIHNIVTKRTFLSSKVNELIDKALASGGNDNVSVILIEV